MDEVKRQAVYLSYLLRIWCEEDAGKFVWRASLESVQTRERQGFASLLALFAFLEQCITTLEHEAEEGTNQTEF